MIILNSYLTFCFSLFTVRFAHGFLARSLMELEELRGVCFFCHEFREFSRIAFYCVFSIYILILYSLRIGGAKNSEKPVIKLLDRMRYRFKKSHTAPPRRSVQIISRLAHWHISTLPAFPTPITYS